MKPRTLSFSRLSRFMATALLAGAAASAQAQQGLPLQMTTYMGLSAGSSRWGVDCGITACAGNPTSYRFYGGQVNAQNFGLEFSLSSLGQGRNVQAGVPVDFSGSSFDLSALYLIRRADSPWGVFIKGGLGYARLRANNTTTGGASRNSFGPVLGAGLMYHVSDSFALRLEANSQAVKSPVGTSGRINTVMLGAQAHY